MSAYQDYKELKTLFRKWCEDKVPMSPEVMRLYWKELKRLERETRCRNADGSHCMEDCRMCEKQRDGAPLSLDQQIEIGDLLPDTFCTEELAEYRELLDSFHAALEYMNEPDRQVAIMSAQGHTEREIAAKLGRCQKTINNRKNAVFGKLRAVLKDYR